MQLNASERSSLLPASAAAAGAGAAAGATAAGRSSQQPSKRQRLYQAPEVRRPFSAQHPMCGSSTSLQTQDPCALQLQGPVLGALATYMELLCLPCRGRTRY